MAAGGSQPSVATDHPPTPEPEEGWVPAQSPSDRPPRFQRHSFQVFPRQLTEGLPRAGSLMGWEDSSQEPGEKGRKESHGENGAKPGRLDTQGAFGTSGGNSSHFLSN